MNGPENADPSALWRAATAGDVDAMCIIEHEVHPHFPERPEVYLDKIELFGAGCRVLTAGGNVVGYGLSYPWILDDVPPLDTLMGAVESAPQCIYIHDVAILPQARAKGAGRAFVEHASLVARRMGLSRLALVSVYDTYPLWAKCGFEITPVRSHPEKLKPYGSTARYMVCPLDRG